MNGQIRASAEQAIDPRIRDFAQETDDAAGLFGRVSPAELENAVHQRLAEQPGLKLTSLSAVDCDLRTCTVVFSGLDANPQYTDEYTVLLTAVYKSPWKDYQLTSGSIGTREVSPGAREYVIGFSYVALVDTSDDPESAARQHATYTSEAATSLSSWPSSWRSGLIHSEKRASTQGWKSTRSDHLWPIPGLDILSHPLELSAIGSG